MLAGGSGGGSGRGATTAGDPGDSHKGRVRIADSESGRRLEESARNMAERIGARGMDGLHAAVRSKVCVCGVCGVWCVVCGVWCVVCGVWCVVCGVWCVGCEV